MIIGCTRASTFGGLVRYLVNDRDHRVIEHKGLTSIEYAAKEMADTGRQRPRVSKPAIHFWVSMAHEDKGRMSDTLWAELFDLLRAELGLGGHLSLEVEHFDTEHEHRHLLACIVHPDTLDTPPDLLPARLSQGKKKAAVSWDAFTHRRLHELANRFARKHGLREVTEISSRIDVITGKSDTSIRREERVGSMSLESRYLELSIALDLPTWVERAQALDELGVDIVAVRNTLRDGTQRLRGIKLVDRADAGNVIAGSKLDKRYGLGALDAARSPASADFETWDAARAALPSRTTTRTPDSEEDPLVLHYLELYRSYERDHVAKRNRLKNERRQLARRQRKRRLSLSDALRRARTRRLRNVPRDSVAAARLAFTVIITNPARARLAVRERDERAQLSMPRKLIWKHWLAARTDDPFAADILAQTSARHKASRQTIKKPRRETGVAVPQVDDRFASDSQVPAHERNINNVRSREIVKEKSQRPSEPVNEKQGAGPVQSQDTEPDEEARRLLSLAERLKKGRGR